MIKEKFKRNLDTTISVFNKNYILILIVIAIAFTPIIFSKVYSGIEFNANTGAIGDTIGGITAPFINILAAILVWISFKEQVKANTLLSKETSFNFINSIVDNFQESFETFKNNEEENYQKVLYFSTKDYPYNDLIIGRHPSISLGMSDEKCISLIKDIDKYFYQTSSKVLGSIKLFSTCLDNIKASSLDDNLKLSFLILLEKEFEFYKKIIQQFYVHFDFLKKTSKYFNHRINLTKVENEINILSEMIEEYSIVKKTLDSN